MGRFLKRLNRGLVLGIVVLIGFIIFVVSDTVAFKKNKPEIKTAVTAYVNSLEELAVTPENLQSIDITEYSNAEKKTIEDEIEKNVTEYWSYQKNVDGKYYGYNQSEFKSSLELLTEKNADRETKDGIGYVTKWTPDIDWNNSNISKNGPDGVKVSLSCKIVADYVGNPYIVTPALPMTVNDMNGTGEAVTITDSENQVQLDGQYVVYMKKDSSGNWKVTFADSWGWSTSTSEITINQDGGDEQ